MLLVAADQCALSGAKRTAVSRAWKCIPYLATREKKQWDEWSSL